VEGRLKIDGAKEMYRRQKPNKKIASMGAIIKQEINATDTDHIFQLDITIDS